MAIHSVSDVTRYIKGLIEREPALGSIQVRGEVSNFKRYASGHCYFTLKDAQSALKCVMFRSSAVRLHFQPENGMQVVGSGRISVYERDGAYQFYVNRMEPEGLGGLAAAFEQLKKKLTAEGLFDEAHKKRLPRYPHTIGIVTSPSGAVLRDIYHVSKRRWPQVKLVLRPVLVQGEQSAEQVADAIRFFNEAYPVDVLIVGRGGGSMEDLWSFNEEVVVRAIYASQIPVISAVGHETDFTLADFAADQRAATPSQAAEFAVPDRHELYRYVGSLQARVRAQAQRGLHQKRLRLEALLGHTALRQPQLLLAERRQRLDRLMARLQELGQGQLEQKKHRLQLTLDRLDLLNPLQVLRRGYGVVEKDGQPLTSVKAVHTGDALDLILQDGHVPATAGRPVPKRQRRVRKED
ncbi:MAG: exodeoxyribonuclease VII large subunit [Selenomonas sp.]|nr:exodeoxyribonuclease VII large subunit [Selenomonas sp.]